MGTNANALHVPLALIAGAQCKHCSEHWCVISITHILPQNAALCLLLGGEKPQPKAGNPPCATLSLHPSVPHPHSPQRPPGMEAPPLQAVPMLTTSSLKKLFLMDDESIPSAAWG